MIKNITSLTNETVKYAFNLKNSSEAKKEGKVLIEGEHLIEMCSDNLIAVFSMTENKKISEEINQYIVTEQIMKKLSSGKSIARIIGIVKLNYSNIDSNTNVVIYLDNVQDPGNVGTILRTALAFDIKNVVLSSNSASIYNSKVLQASQGSIFNLNIACEDYHYIEKLKKERYVVVSTMLDKNAINLDDFNQLPPKMILVMGNEGVGISEEIKKLTDTKLYIPILNIDSLNVAIAFALVANKIKNIDRRLR